MTTTELVSDDGRNRVYRVLDGGVEVGTNIETILTTEETNARTLRDRARAALAANANYLALFGPTINPTAEQTRTQVRRLTQECSALIRLLLDQTDTTEGT